MLAAIALVPAAGADVQGFVESCGGPFPPEFPPTCDPNELQEDPDLSALDDFCQLNPGAVDPTFPGCLEELADPSALDGLCAELAPDAEDQTFPACLEEASPDAEALCGIVAPGSELGFPDCLGEASPDLDACATLAPDSESEFPACLEDADLPSADALCAAAGDVEGIFPDCITAIVLTAIGPVVDTATQAVADAQTQLGAATFENPLLGPIVNVDTVGTNNYVGLASSFSGTYSRGALGDVLRSADTIGILDITFEVLANGATAGVADFVVDDEALTYSFSYIAGTAGDVDFAVAASYGQLPLTGGEEFTVSFDEVSSDDIDLHVTVSAVDTALNNIVFTPAYPTHAVGAEASKTLSVQLQDDNGVSEITSASLSTVVELAGGGEHPLTSSSTTQQTQGSLDPFPSIEDYHYEVAFPSRLKDGDYVFRATYDGEQGPLTATVSVNVPNVAPTITSGTALDLATGKATPISGALAVSVDDLNFGNFHASAAPVSEISALEFTVTATGSADPEDIRIFVAGETVELTAGAGSFSLASDDSMTAIAKSIEVAYSQAFGLGESDNGLLTVTVRAVDDDTIPSDVLTIAEILVQPFEAGFGLDVDDGGNGIQIDEAAPGQTRSNSADPLNIEVTKQVSLGVLRFEVPAFSDGAGHSIATDGITVSICVDATDAATCIATPTLTGTIDEDGIATIDEIGGLGVSGTKLDVYFTLTVPFGTAGGAYTSAATVLGIPAA